ncbi:similar to Saccharomyces cerevisiae YHR209W CRG1 mRNA binding protein and putative S-adenosylmethionine-dependent methyltransferase [Maudiozyma saulgeensis]|uniref:Similar to Saccharomyces cerevisiae YHR209W CRG1 mRNA binding protein and putative S-adenosylmethionine-dependent methyltransferase n=1 Tax=Maudiozyma saulgeensis TaxID=1789683 RepID=A0A1X7R7S9_9SACH|nr:similar to Saccharomyces cerevisiae YHR209W CRG1 mRNA binding protein and putative S-adenosylmethionine-dependent methyltransferase [Kazachstania saulgeensis]
MPETSYLSVKDFDSQRYHDVRPSYPQSLVDKIMDYHQGSCNELIDVGCGTGISTVLFAPHFKHAVGLDPSDSMLSVAKKNYPKLEFASINGEELIKSGIKPNSIDMVIGAESIHWCDLDKVFGQVNQVLRPQGTFAFWFYVQPEFIDLGRAAHDLYVKYCWTDEYMGKYLTDYQRKFFTNFGGNDVNIKLNQYGFKDVYHEIVNEFKDDGLFTNQTIPSFLMEGTITLNDFKKFVQSWSLYTSWTRDHPGEPDIADQFIAEFQEQCHIDSLTQPLKIEWATFYYLCRK